MASDAVINGLFALGGVGVAGAVAATTAFWQDRRATRTRDETWRRSTVSDAQKRLAAISALGRAVPAESDKSGDSRTQWKAQLDGLIDETESHVLSLSDEEVRKRVIKALGFMRYCTGYVDIAQHFGESVSVEGVIFVTTKDAKECLAAHLRSNELPSPPDRYAVFESIDEYQEDQYQMNLEAEQDRRDGRKDDD